MLTDRGRYALALGGVTYLAGWAFGSDRSYPVAVGLVLVVVGAALWVRLSRSPCAFAARFEAETTSPATTCRSRSS